MVNAWLIRLKATDQYTRGLLLVGGKVFHTIERPWLNNQRNISCIPAGVYDVNFMARSASGKYKNVYHLLDVPGRSGILIHNGNLVEHSRGCIIVGKTPGSLANKAAVLQSKPAMRELVQAFTNEPGKIHVIGNQ